MHCRDQDCAVAEMSLAVHDKIFTFEDGRYVDIDCGGLYRSDRHVCRYRTSLTANQVMEYY